MILRLALFVLMAVGLGGFGTVAWLSTRAPAAHHAPAPKPVALLAAAHALQPGALLKPTDLGAMTGRREARRRPAPPSTRRRRAPP